MVESSTTEPTLSLGDTIRVVNQPLGQWDNIVGQLGFIDEIHEDGHYQVMLLDENGKPSGSGCMTDEHIEADTSHAATCRKRSWEAKIGSFYKSVIYRRRRFEADWRAAVEEQAKVQGVDVDVVHDIGLALLDVFSKHALIRR